LNGDEKLDIAVANGQDASVSVLLGNGDGTFQAQVRYNVQTSPYAVAAGELNGDGKIDLVAVNLLSGTVSALRGNGDGTFQPQFAYDCDLTSANDQPTSVVVADFDGDGQSDFAVADIANDRFSIHTTLLQIGAHSAGLLRPHALTVADFDGSGRPDLAVTNYGSDNVGNDTVTVVRNDGSGGFATYAAFPVGNLPSAVAAADFNGDGKSDVAVANSLHNTVSVLLGNGDGTLRGQVALATGAYPFSVAVGDFNGDGRPDLAVANTDADTVSVLTNDLLFADGFDQL
jgi:hypothetical protein